MANFPFEKGITLEQKNDATLSLSFMTFGLGILNLEKGK